MTSCPSCVRFCMSKFYCPLPWNTVYINNDGTQKFCCRSEVTMPRENLDFNHEEVRKVRLQMLNDEVPESCNYCSRAEKDGAPSLRQEALGFGLSEAEARACTEGDGSTTALPLKYDLIMGNRCNLKCMMCMPWCSSSWVEDWEMISEGLLTDETGKEAGGPFTIGEVNGKLKVLPDVFSWVDNQEFMDLIWGSIRDSSRTHERVNLWFSGGEVTLNPSFKQILERLVEEGLQDKVEIQILSNGTTLSPKLESLIRSFPHIKVHFSVDAVGKKNDYIRYPSKFSVVEKNVNRVLDKAGLIYVTVSAMNVFDVDEIIRWCEDLGLQARFEVVYGPLIWLSPLSLSARHRQEAYKRLINVARGPLKHTKKEDVISLAEMIKNTQRWQPNPREFWKLIRKFDRVRSTDFLGTFETWRRLR